MTRLLRASDVHVRFGEKTAVARVGLELAAGEVVALIGPNGSGKSTLMRALLGVVPSEGFIGWEGRALDGWDRRALARRVAYLPQSPLHEPGQSVRDVLRMGRAPYWAGFGIENRRDGEIVEAVFAQLDLPDRPMEQLSGGQRQRVYVGRCLVQEPASLLLDEPDTYLDLRYAVALHREIRRLANERQIGVLCTSHDLNAAAAFADRLILLSEGRIAAEGSADAVMQPEMVSRVFGVELERIERAGSAPLLVPRAALTAG